MSFNSFIFPLFALLVWSAHRVIPHGMRQTLLLAASYVFYAYSYALHLGWLLLVTAATWAGARAVSGNRSRVRLVGVVGLVLTPLLLVKYFDFLIGLAEEVTGMRATSPLSLVLPIGVSFYTFQAVSYIIDVYRGTVTVENRLGRVALYLAWFPQILAGPIERAGRLLPQLHFLRPGTAENLYIGAKYALWGYFCKVVVADNVALIVDALLAAPSEQSGGTLAVAFTLYSFQIYFDFLGYTNIAIGVARAFGVRLSRNFRRPYGAYSIREFWRRWHITLSSWFRDYVYVPLGGKNTRGIPRIGQVLTVFVLSGLWHGAALNFLAWGSVHGVAYAVEDAVRRLRDRFRHVGRSRAPTGLSRIVRTIATFTFVTLAWVFFRLSNWPDIRAVCQKLLLVDGAASYGSLNAVLLRPDSILVVFVLLTAITFDSCRALRSALASVPLGPGGVARELLFVNWSVVTLLLLGDTGARDFIYYRF